VIQSISSGTPFAIVVAAVDSEGSLDQTYRATWTFVSSDRGATLPPSYALAAGDVGRHEFVVVLRTVGTQTITASDSGNTVAAGTMTMIVTAPAGSAGIPAIGRRAAVLVALVLAASGMWLSRAPA
jgi:hypothetical protein